MPNFFPEFTTALLSGFLQTFLAGFFQGLLLRCLPGFFPGFLLAFLQDFLLTLVFFAGVLPGFAPRIPTEVLSIIRS